VLDILNSRVDFLSFDCLPQNY